MGLSQNILPDAPKGTRMSEKGKNLILLIVGILCAFLVYAIFHFSGGTQNDSNASKTIKSSDLTGDQQKNNETLNQLNVQANSPQADGNLPPNMAGLGSGGQSTIVTPQGADVPPVNVGNPPNGESGNLTQRLAGLSNSIGTPPGQTDPRAQALQQGMASGLSFGSGDAQQSSASVNTPQSNAGAVLQAPSTSGASSTDSFNAQNMQDQKTSFAQNAGSNNQDTLNQAVQNPVSPFMIMAGSVIPATLITGINSDLPGEMQAVVSQNVYDSSSGNNILIPQGSRLVGTYDSQVAYGQSRVLIVWSRIIFPNTQYLDLEGMPGADLSGYAGLHDQVDNHYFRIFGSALLMSVFSAGMQLSQPASSNATAQPTNQQLLAAALGQNIGEVATQMAQKNLNIQPTIMIRPGDQFNVLITRDIPFSGPYSDGNAPSIISSAN